MDFFVVLFWTYWFPLLVVLALVVVGVYMGTIRWQHTVVCEACGQKFQSEDGYYEPGEYAYCRDCCHW